MRSIAIIIAYFFVHCLVAQVTSSHKLKLGIGHEWNAFLSPSTQLENEELLSRSELWDNGTFQALSVHNTFKQEARNHRFKLKADGSLGIFQTEQNSNRYTFRLGASYRVKYAPRKYFEFAPELFRKKREGLNVDNAVLATPFSYLTIRMPIGLDFYLGNKAWIKAQTGYLYKEYDKPAGEKLFYHAPYFETTLSKKWDTGSLTKKLSLKSLTQFRAYETLSLLEDEEDEPRYRAGSRDWTYQFTTLLFDISKGKNNSLAIGFYHTSRLDQNQRSTYHELGPGLKSQNSVNKWHFSTGLRYSVRRYVRLAPGADNDTPLRYQYVRATGEIIYAFTQQRMMFLKGNLVHRTSNNPNTESLAFRGYTNGLLEMGLKWKW